MNRLIMTLLFIGITYSIFGQTKNYIDQPYLETTANIDTLVTPDLIYLKILLNEGDKRNRVSIKDMETKLFQKLESLGINLQEQLVLFDFASNFKKYIFQSKKIIKEKAFSLKLYDTKTAGKVLEQLEEINISNINLYKSEYSKIEQLKLELKSKAILKAKKQAEYLIEPLSQAINRAIFISDKYFEEYTNDFYLDEIVVTGYGGPKQKQEYNQPNIEFKPIRVESQVTVKFAIE